MSLKISLEEARAEAVWLRTQIHQKGSMCKSSILKKILDSLCKVLAYIAHKERQQKQLDKQARQPPPYSPNRLARSRPPPTTRPFFKGQNNQKLCLPFCHSLVSHPTSFFCTIYCIEFWFFLSVIPSQNIYSVSNPCNISVGCVFC